MNKNNLIKVLIASVVFIILIAPLISSVFEEGAGVGGSTIDVDSSPTTDNLYTSPKDYTQPVEFPKGYEDLLDKEEKTIEDWEEIEKIEKENNLGCVTVGDVKIPLNTNTYDGNIGATDDTFEIKGYDQLCQFKTLTSKSGEVIFFGNSALDIESISIKDGEVVGITFKNKDSENEVLITQAIGQGIGVSFSKEEQKEEGGSISLEEEDFITADKGISFSVGDNKITVEESETKIKIEPLEDSDSYYDKGVYIGASFNIEQGEIYVEGETSKLKISYASPEIKEEPSEETEKTEETKTEESEKKEKVELSRNYIFLKDQKEFSILKETEKIQEETEIIFGFDGNKYIFLQDFEEDQINFFELPWIGSVEGEQEPASEGVQKIDQVTIEGGDKLDSILEEKPLPTLEEDIDEFMAALKESKIEIADGDSEKFALWVEENKEWLVEEGLDLPSEELETKYKEWVEQKSISNEFPLLFDTNTEKAEAVLEAAYSAAEEEKSGQHCWDAVAGIIYTEIAKVGWETVFVNLPEGDDRVVPVKADPEEQRDNIIPGDIVEYHLPGKDYGHNVIVLEVVDEDKGIFKVAQQSYPNEPITIRNQPLVGDYAPIIVWRPV